MGSHHPSLEGQSRGRNGAEAQEAGALCLVPPAGGGGGGAGPPPSLPDSRALGLRLRGPRRWWQLQQAGAGWAGVLGTRQAGRQEGGGPDDWASQPCLIALGAGCVWEPSPDGPQRQCRPPALPPLSPLQAPLLSASLGFSRPSICLFTSCPVTPNLSLHLSFPAFL